MHAPAKGLLILTQSPKPERRGYSMKDELEDYENEEEHKGMEEKSKAERVEAAKAMIVAMKKGDPDALDEALQAHYVACEGYEE